MLVSQCAFEDCTCLIESAYAGGKVDISTHDKNSVDKVAPNLTYTKSVHNEFVTLVT